MWTIAFDRQKTRANLKLFTNSQDASWSGLATYEKGPQNDKNISQSDASHKFPRVLRDQLTSYVIVVVVVVVVELWEFVSELR
jgi:hypothetical protein